ncbi:hypothetical protein M422DRAFT_248102 [Sphaerobolus stellatus SS14]|uniref:Myb-like domain-containing protein n=1 Tax=Sphaerobolus stellatus (strain SS14) TaxID=990650 RepID=A0A0C9W5Y1_SPHS4|nr:hypothetical protein M422DRAFT_248102 [Sphaerobolus stellatus SS14]
MASIFLPKVPKVITDYVLDSSDLEITTAEQILTEASSAFGNAEKKLKDFQRGRTTIQHAHHYFHIVLKMIERGKIIQLRVRRSTWRCDVALGLCLPAQATAHPIQPQLLRRMPPVTRRQAQQHQPERSPSWECETGSLPVDDSQPPSPTSSPNSDIGSNTGVGSDEEDFEDPSNNNKHVRNARSPNWLPWQDRFLLREVSAHRPFLASRHDAAAEWNSLAARLKENSRKQGSMIDRTGPGCRSRFRRLVLAHRQNETRSLQKTGANEEIDEHVQWP